MSVLVEKCTFIKKTPIRAQELVKKVLILKKVLSTRNKSFLLFLNVFNILINDKD
jgi:hypothetical protein